MLRTSDNETEILLGNKQLLGIFFAVAILLAIAFYGGYMVGRGSASKKAAGTGAVENATTSGATQSETSGQTRTLPADSGALTQGPSDERTGAAIKGTPGSHELAGQSVPNSSETPLGGRKHKQKAPVTQPDSESTTGPASNYIPEPGSQYLQVVAISKNEAEGLADVLHKKGFRAHAVPKPGSSTVYRVIVGPIKDAGDLSSTRDALRKTGFREVIVQRY